MNQEDQNQIDKAKELAKMSKREKEEYDTEAARKDWKDEGGFLGTIFGKRKK